MNSIKSSGDYSIHSASVMYSSSCSCDIEYWQSSSCTTEYGWTG